MILTLLLLKHFRSNKVRSVWDVSEACLRHEWDQSWDISETSMRHEWEIISVSPCCYLRYIRESVLCLNDSYHGEKEQSKKSCNGETCACTYKNAFIEHFSNKIFQCKILWKTVTAMKLRTKCLQCIWTMNEHVK